MNVSDKGPNVIQGNGGQVTNRLPTARLQITAAAIGLVVLLVGGARYMPQSDVDRVNDAAAQPRAEVQLPTEPTTLDYFPDSPDRDADGAKDAAPQRNAEAQEESTTISYFPAQYVNQATEVEEHIQAF